MEYVLGAVGLLIGGALGFFAERAIRGTAFKTRDEILQQAQRDGENLVKTAELQAKEEALRRREAADKELNAARDELLSGCPCPSSVARHRDVEQQLVSHEKTVAAGDPFLVGIELGRLHFSGQKCDVGQERRI